MKGNFAHYLIQQLRFNDNCINAVFVSAVEADKFAEDINQFAKEIRELGPNPIRL